MRAVVLHESLYGNTEAIAGAIGDGLKAAGSVRVSSFDDADEGSTVGADLIVLGGPTHGWSMTKPSSREQKDTEGYEKGVREWLEAIEPLPGTRFAAFDTRFDKPRWLTGSAAVKISRKLERAGCVLVAPPESFFVQHTKGPLGEGEIERARRWGAELSQRTAQEDAPRS